MRVATNRALTPATVPEVDAPDLHLIKDPGPWVEDAACASTDPDLFFPTSGSGWTTAVKICLDCPVKGQCLQYALEAEEGNDSCHRFGVYGGTTPRTRARIARERSAA